MRLRHTNEHVMSRSSPRNLGGVVELRSSPASYDVWGELFPAGCRTYPGGRTGGVS